MAYNKLPKKGNQYSDFVQKHSNKSTNDKYTLRLRVHAVVGDLRQRSSSVPSWQSLKPSHCFYLGIQYFDFWHSNSKRLQRPCDVVVGTVEFTIWWSKDIHQPWYYIYVIKRSTSRILEPTEAPPSAQPKPFSLWCLKINIFLQLPVRFHAMSIRELPCWKVGIENTGWNLAAPISVVLHLKTAPDYIICSPQTPETRFGWAILFMVSECWWL